MSSSEPVPEHIVEFLRSERARVALDALATENLNERDTLAILTALRRTFAPEEASSLLTLARLRGRASNKFPHADEMYFTPDALEQATAWTVAQHRAETLDRLAVAGPVLDLGCGIGGDTLALAHVRPVLAYERDAARLAFAEANVVAWKHAGASLQSVVFCRADWSAELAAGRLPDAAAAFIDPSRRVGGRRVFSLHQMQPPLKELLRVQAQVPNLCAKVMPGVDKAELPEDSDVEFISHEGVCKEAVLWFGELRQHGCWASVHDGDAWHTLVASDAEPPVGSIEPGDILYEPDPAAIRAGAFAELCNLLDAHLIDPHIAYFVSGSHRPTPFAKSFKVYEIHPFHLRRLNERLRALGINQVELKKRGAPFAPESLRNRLKLPEEGSPGVIFFTRLHDAPSMIIARRI